MSTRARTIAVVTGSRAEFGLLTPVMRAIDEHPRLTLKVIVAGSHLITGTWRTITTEGFTIHARVRMQRRPRDLSLSARGEDAKATGRGIASFIGAFEKLKPDIVLVLGDRIEAFAAASAASIGGVKVAHIHGGDRAEGVADEAMRHAISKLAHIHFAASAASRRRLLRMGEWPDAVFNTGSPAADGLRAVKPAADAPDVIVLQHPIGATDAQEKRWMAQTLAATRQYDRIVMSPNADPGAAGIRAAIRAGRIKAIENLPRDQWLSVLAGAKVIVGNSSAGLIEAAVLKTPCVNIGPRQAGRERPRNIIDCDYGVRSVRRAIQRAIKLNLSRMRHPYGDGRTGQCIANILASKRLDRISIRKHNAS